MKKKKYGHCGRVGYSAEPIIRRSWVRILPESVIIGVLGKFVSTALSIQRSKTQWYNEESDGIVSWSVLHANEQPGSIYIVCSLGSWDVIRNEQAQWSGVMYAVDRAVSMDVETMTQPLYVSLYIYVLNTVYYHVGFCCAWGWQFLCATTCPYYMLFK